MILFYNQTGEIIGTISGRIHDKSQLNMWIGDKSEIKRLVVNWVKTPEGFKPDHSQAKLFSQIEESPALLKDCIVENNMLKKRYN